MDNEKEISFGAFDSELMHQEIFIPEGFTATIDGDKIILTRKDSEDERIRKALIRFHKSTIDIDGIKGDEIVAWLEKQGTYTKKDVDDAFVEGMVFAKNELEKQGEQKPTDEDMKEALRTEYEKGRADAIVEKQKEWSEEDECTLNGILDDYKSMCKTYRNWLESLKNRIQPQPKQEWSEEDDDDAWMNDIISKVENNLQLNKAEIDFLKSLKYRYTWKPSDEQMKALDSIAGIVGILSPRGVTLCSLYHDLEKLKGE